MSGVKEQDLPTLVHAAKIMATTYGEAEGDLKRLRDLVYALTSSWQGSASLAFGQTMDRWETASWDLLASLDGIQKKLISTAGDYGVNQQQITHTMASLDIPSYTI